MIQKMSSLCFSNFLIALYLPNAAILLLNIFTAMANSITPKNFRTASKPAGPSAFSTTLSDFKTIYTTTRLMMIPLRIYSSSKLASYKGHRISPAKIRHGLEKARASIQQSDNQKTKNPLGKLFNQKKYQLKSQPHADAR